MHQYIHSRTPSWDHVYSSGVSIIGGLHHAPVPYTVEPLHGTMSIVVGVSIIGGLHHEPVHTQ